MEDKTHSGTLGSSNARIYWRLGNDHPKEKHLLLRWPLDRKKRGAAKKSKYYLKYGRPLGAAVYVVRGKGKGEEEGEEMKDVVER